MEPLENFKNFNEFFYRKLKPGARTLASDDPSVAISPADCRLSCFPSVSTCTKLWVKGNNFTLPNLLQDDDLADEFDQGAVCICRLAPQDYHRFHFPIDGKITEIRRVEGTYFTVNPMAVRTVVDVYTENVRTMAIMESAQYGKVVMVCVGAMLVGSIVLTHKDGEFKRWVLA